MTTYGRLPEDFRAQHIQSPGAVATRGRVVDVTFSERSSNGTTISTVNPPTAVLHTHSFETKAQRSTLVITVNVGAECSNNANVLRLGLLLDTVRVTGRGFRADRATCCNQVSLDYVAVDVPAGSHTLDVVWSISANTATCNATSSQFIHGVSVRVTEYDLRKGSNDLGHLTDPYQVAGGRLIRTYRSVSDAPLLRTTSTAVPPTDVMHRIDFVTERYTAVLIDAYLFSVRPSSTGSGSVNYNYGLSIDGTQVYGRRSATRTTNQSRQTQLTHTTKSLEAGQHKLEITWSGANALVANHSADGLARAGQNVNMYFGYNVHLHIREYAL